jgi:hypothetical protein
MFVTLFTFLFPAFQLLFPAYLVYNLWTARYRGIDRWLVHALTAVGVLGFLFVIGRWDIAGYFLRYWLYGIYLVAVLLSTIRIYGLPFRTAHGWSLHWSTAADLLLLAGLMGWTFTGLAPESPSVDMSYPLRGDSYYVAHGGTMLLFNYHGMFAESQRHALDIARLNSWGFRAAGIYPDDLDSYTVFGDTVYSPIPGTVVAVEESLHDQIPPRRRPEKPAGNHIWIRSDSLFILLAHLKHNSVRIEKGASVTRRQALAQVGNTGNTTAPHLHIHAVTYREDSIPTADSLLHKGDPVPLKLDDQYLIRNDVFGAGDS